MKARPPSPAAEDAASRRDGSALDWAVRAGVADGVLRELAQRAQRRARRRRRTAAGAAAALIVASAVALWWRPAQNGVHGREAEFANLNVASATVSLPERRELPDGSTIELRDGAEVRVAFTDELRRVELLRGEAHFEVAKNPARPFVVTAGGYEVRAVGTAFVVQVAPEAIEVLVTEGRVAVEQPRGDAPEAMQSLALLGAGRRVVIDTTVSLGEPGLPVLAVDATEAAQRLAWRVPRLEFSGTPLGEAVPMFNRHSTVQLRLGDAAIARVQLSGIIRADNPEPLFRLLRDNYGIVAETGADGVVVLRRQL